MGAIINLRLLDEGPKRLTGEVSPKELGLEDLGDELVQVTEPLRFDVEVSKEGDGGILVSGKVDVDLHCQCGRCLQPFSYPVRLDPYHAFVPLEGEEAAPVANDSVDLAPIFREDTILAFPLHPLCKDDCAGLAKASGGGMEAGGKGAAEWGALDQLKF